MADASRADVARHLDERLASHPHLAKRILRQLLVLLHKRSLVSIERIYSEARQKSGLSPRPMSDDPNQPAGERWGEAEREAVAQLTRDHACIHFSSVEIDDVIALALKREEARDLSDIINLDAVSFRLLADQVHRFLAVNRGEPGLEPSEVMGIRVELIRRLINDQLEFIGVAKNHLHIADFDDLMSHTLGSDNGMGRIGGKAGGMFLAHKILERTPGRPELRCRIPESYYLRSDVVNDFLDFNGLQSYRNQKYKSVEDVREEYPLVKSVFRNADFPIEIVQGLRTMLDEIGTHPLIVRSSSLLEDRLGTAFYGKYASVFLTNQGDLEERLRTVLAAVGEVYASIFAADPILYRREHRLLDYDEDMAVLIQKVVGCRIGRFFLPTYAGVAFSRNEYSYSPRIRRQDGLMRLVMGLGTRAVDRVGSDYPRMVALGEPTLRPESDSRVIRRMAQRGIDVLDLESNTLRTVGLADLIAQPDPIPGLDEMVSVWRDDELYRPTGTRVPEPAEWLCITFDKMMAEGDLPHRMRRMLARLEEAYGVPVDVEFASDGTDLYLLQCRSQNPARGPHLGAESLVLPKNIDEDRVVFTACRYIRSGLAPNLEYAVYVDPLKYNEIPSRERRVAVGRVVGRLNRLLHDKAYVLMGPGRWGSKDILLGVPVSYADINHARLLVEMARSQEDYVPELSFGTHFFQDLVEAGIHYLPLYPDEAGNVFREAFFTQTTSVLAELLPDAADFDAEIRVVHVPSAAQGQTLHVVMNGEKEQAMGYLE